MLTGASADRKTASLKTKIFCHRAVFHTRPRTHLQSLQPRPSITPAAASPRRPLLPRDAPPPCSSSAPTTPISLRGEEGKAAQGHTARPTKCRDGALIASVPRLTMAVCVASSVGRRHPHRAQIDKLSRIDDVQGQTCGMAELGLAGLPLCLSRLHGVDPPATLSDLLRQFKWRPRDRQQCAPPFFRWSPSNPQSPSFLASLSSLQNPDPPSGPGTLDARQCD